MAVYEYTAKDTNGNKFSGICDDIDSIATLRQDLSKMGDTLLRAKRKRTDTSRAKITQDEIVTFTFKLAQAPWKHSKSRRTTMHSEQY